MTREEFLNLLTRLRRASVGNVRGDSSENNPNVADMAWEDFAGEPGGAACPRRLTSNRPAA